MAKIRRKLRLACAVIILLLFIYTQGYVYMRKFRSSKDLSSKPIPIHQNSSTFVTTTLDGAAGKNNSEEVVHGLPQKKAAVLHRLSKSHFNLEPVEADNTLTARPLTENEQAGNNILFTLRTTMKFHQQRLPVLFDTWLTTVNTSNVFLVTDGEDTKWKGRAGMDAKLNHSFYLKYLCLFYRISKTMMCPEFLQWYIQFSQICLFIIVVHRLGLRSLSSGGYFCL